MIGAVFPTIFCLVFFLLKNIFEPKIVLNPTFFVDEKFIFDTIFFFLKTKFDWTLYVF